jgi:hypothetical protein
MVAVIAVFGVILANAPTSPSAPQTKSSGDKDVPGYHDLVDDKKFIAENPGMLAAIAALIDKSGYDCPSLAHLRVKGPSPYGIRLEALCGPDDGKRSVYPQMHYAVYPEKFKVNLCSEFGVFSKECE